MAFSAVDVSGRRRVPAPLRFALLRLHAGRCLGDLPIAAVFMAPRDLPVAPPPSLFIVEQGQHRAALVVVGAGNAVRGAGTAALVPARSGTSPPATAVRSPHSPDGRKPHSRRCRRIST